MAPTCRFYFVSLSQSGRVKDSICILSVMIRGGNVNKRVEARWGKIASSLRHVNLLKYFHPVLWLWLKDVLWLLLIGDFNFIWMNIHRRYFFMLVGEIFAIISLEKILRNYRINSEMVPATQFKLPASFLHGYIRKQTIFHQVQSQPDHVKSEVDITYII